MPISTPSNRVADYGDDADHFAHVLDCLFVPAVEAAGFEPWLPTATAADLIHAEFCRGLCQAELVLVDLSGLNPNVFFELGLRTGRDGPTCLVCDDKTDPIPVDVGIWNFHRYDSTLRAWKLEGEIAVLADHLRASARRSAGHNTFWQRFGVADPEHPPEPVPLRFRIPARVNDPV
ncbi:hypothetical protein [Phytohabitans rumicis]|uniref:Uncharacterized protein n=1 Tax=Phytohabitans rumicis TaxID=1076125 RepID=A0A6V8LG03_9ACTN|nr:hypothetical protein [Phytohabitans rumicis]GFJ94580.1 hypothetical protein Prum_082220 [Phytohabitans rumicis]